MDLLNSQSLVPTLVCCLEDTYESTQQRALSLLTTISKEIYCTIMTDSQLSNLLKKALKYLYSSRTQDSMSAAYMLLSSFVDSRRSLTVLSQLDTSDMKVSFENLAISKSTNSAEELSLLLIHTVLQVIRHQVDEAKNDLVLASQEYPLYPALMSLRYLLRKAVVTDVNRWSKIIQEVFAVIHNDIHLLVAPVVCHSSPEGYLPPDDTEDKAPRRPSLPQYLVVCCWRTVKEISLVYGAIMENVVPTHHNIVTKNQICEYIKSFYESILQQAKHRGAFEMAYTGYCSYWHTVWRLSSCQDLVAEFLVDSPYSMLLNKDLAESLCATRRSAGLPFMVQAYVTAEPRLQNHYALIGIMNTLLPMSLNMPLDDSTSYSQAQRVHALNILRALYKASPLGDAVQPFVSVGLQSAITGYKSQVWAVRNASTMLFSALITRMFGVKQGKDDLSKQSGMAGRLFFQKYPEMHPFLMQELETCTEFRAPDGQTLLQPSLYLLLIVLCKLYPSQKESADASLSLDVFVPYLYRCASSPVYKTRMLAAHALANTLSQDSVPEAMKYLCENVSISSEHNRLHGLFLQVYHLYACVPDASLASVGETVANMLRSTYRAILSSRCELVKASYIDIIKGAKQQLVDVYPDLAPTIIMAALGASKEGFEWSTDIVQDWTKVSIDLQLSRCRLLLDTNEPSMCTREVLLELLHCGRMYEVHHEILSTSLAQGIQFLSPEDYVDVMAHMIGQQDHHHLSYNTLQSVNLSADILSEACSRCTINLSLAMKIKKVIGSIVWEQPSMSLLRLESHLLTLTGCLTLESVHSILEELLNYLRGDAVDTEGLRQSVEIAKLIGQALFYPNVHAKTDWEVPPSFWVAWVLLIFNLDSDISSRACVAIITVFAVLDPESRKDCDPHISMSSMLRCMRAVYHDNTTKDILQNWLEHPHIWLSLAAVQGIDECEDEDRLFEKAEGQLLCDPISFYNIVRHYQRSLF
ncbi:tRNA (32-2'-O)-methyltransferase regulator THADA-like [Watersipora subatra]|uniref:tRNA (32-2'-O)-methyltransferase regulator THADA-like n=1 Tax=Watersipora subatra TaxID=2589382 RepID=UPI00355B4A73